MITILIGNSCSGKETIMQALLKENIEIVPVISTTTRPMREGETDGVDYHFVDEDAFQKLIEEGKLLEYRKSEDGYYGCEAIPDISEHDYIKILDADGAKKYAEHYGKENCFIVMITANENIRKERAEIRSDDFDEQKWNTRRLNDETMFETKKIEDVANFFLVNDGIYFSDDIIYDFYDALDSYTAFIEENKDKDFLKEEHVICFEEESWNFKDPPEIWYKTTTIEALNREGYREEGEPLERE